MDATVINHWRTPSWQVIAVAFGVGVAMAVLSWPLAGLLPPVQTKVPLWAFPFLSLISSPLEEWFFRGVLLKRLATAIRAVPALILTSALFAMVHLSLPSFPIRFAAGVVLGILYLRTRSLWPSIVAHYVHNAVLVVLTALIQSR